MSAASCPMILVTGGKGGVGKTTLAANLGVALAKRARVLVADFDLGLANLDVMLGLRAEATVEHYLDGSRPIRECVVEGPDGLDVLAAGSGVHALARLDDERRQRLLAGIAELSSRYDFVVADSAAGIGPDVLTFAAAADRVVVVTTPEPAAVTDAYGVLKALDGFAGERSVEIPTPEVFVNLADGATAARRVAERIRSVSERFLVRSPRYVGWMPRSRGVQESVAAQRPFAASDPRSLASRCLMRLAERLLGDRGALVPRSPSRARATRSRRQPKVASTVSPTASRGAVRANSPLKASEDHGR